MSVSESVSEISNERRDSEGGEGVMLHNSEGIDTVCHQQARER